VHLDVFEGPSTCCSGLIAKHKLDITEIALAKVTDEFIAHLGRPTARHEWDLSQASEFLLVAATLLDLKAARLLPTAGEEDEEDLALIEARDLLFARLLQYRAFKEVATFADQMARRGRLTPPGRPRTALRQAAARAGHGSPPSSWR
jgi:segregation and condensation protein A